MELSNRTLSLFILASLVVTLVGTSITLNEINKWRGYTSGGAGAPIGMATGTGNVSVYIASSTNMTILNNTVFFGQGVVSVNCTNATLHTNQSNAYASDNRSGLEGNPNTTTNNVQFGNLSNNTNIGNCWINTTDNGSSLGHSAPIIVNRSGIIIRNDGNVNISVTMNSGDNDAATFLGGASPSPAYNFTVNDEESGSCPTAGVFHAPTHWTGVNSSADQKICDHLKFADSTDTVNITFRIVFASTVTGEKTDTLTFTSTLASG